MHCRASSEPLDCRRAGSVVVIGPAAAAGALIDRARRRFDTIFDHTGPSSRELRVSPIFTARHKGVAVTLSY
jgi:hypothetical protein